MLSVSRLKKQGEPREFGVHLLLINSSFLSALLRSIGLKTAENHHRSRFRAACQPLLQYF